jgi:predicted NBD/HSP70 family sugar kinase
MQIDGTALIRLAVLKTIRREGPISRVELARINRLGGATISQVTGELLQRGMIIEERRSPEGKGRPRILLSIDPSAAVVLGGSLGPRGELEISLVDLGGNLLLRDVHAMGHHRTVASLTTSIAEQLRCFIDAHEVERSVIASVAIALPASIENPGGVVHWLPTMEAGSTPVRGMLSRALELPVTIENDIDCLARAEHWFGRKPSGADFTVLMVGLTIGSAEYVDGIPRSGANGLSSEFGHVKTVWGEEARRCFCGGRGCLTAYASTAGMILSSAPAPDLFSTMPSDIERPFRDLADAAAAGNENARSAIRLAGTYLGRALANLINARDPGLVLVRYTDPDMPALLGQSIMAALDENSLPTVRERTEVDIGFVDDGWRWQGAAALALEQMYLGEGAGRAGGSNDR